MGKKLIFIYSIIYILSFVLLSFFAFNNLEEIIWLKYIMVSLVSLIPLAAVLLFSTLHTYFHEGTLKERTHRVMFSDAAGSKKIDRVVFITAYSLFIPLLILFYWFPFLFGLPFFITGIYSIITGRTFYAIKIKIIYSDSRLFSTIKGVLEIILSWLIWKNAHWVIEGLRSTPFL